MKQFLENQGISLNKLARLAGTSSSQIHNIVSGKKFGTDKLIDILEALPDLNPIWLLFGVGQAKKDTSPATEFLAHESQAPYMSQSVLIDLLQEKERENESLRRQLAILYEALDDCKREDDQGRGV